MVVYILNAGEITRGTMVMNSMYRCARTIIPILLISMVFLSCNEYNPFNDYANAEAVIEKTSFNENDTVTVFTLDTISISINVPNLIDSVTVFADGNYKFVNGRKTVRCNSSDTVITALQNLVLSYDSVGKKNIIVYVYKKNGDVIKTFEKSLYVRLPRFTDNIAGYYNHGIILSCEAVNNRDVVYQWSFSDTVIRTFSQLDTVILSSGGAEAGQGFLNLINGQYRSEIQQFSFSIQDSSAPRIKVVGEANMKNDTILSANTEFPLKVIVTDIGQNDKISVRLNQSDTFDIVRDSLYIKIIDSLDRLSGFAGYEIVARDNSARRNASRKKIWIGYNSAGVKSRKWKASILIPSADTSKSTVEKKTLYGMVDRFTKDSISLNVNIAVNGTVKRTISFLKNDYWTDTVSLIKGLNTVRVIASDGVESDTISRVILFNDVLVDSTGPVIKNIVIDNVRENQFVTESRINVKLIAFDENGRVSNVSCNGFPMVRSDESEYVWEINNMNLEFKNNVAEINVIAKDDSGNCENVNRIIRFNTRPKITKFPSFEIPARAGKTYRDTIAVIDPDKSDSISYSISSTDTNTLKIDKRGIVTWKPSRDTVIEYTIWIKDKYETVQFTDTLYSVDSSATVPELKADNIAGAFPKTFILDDNLQKQDTLTADCVPESGTPPFKYNVSVNGMLNGCQISGNRLIWLPSKNDTGLARFEIIITDKYGKKDTAYPLTAVMRGNRPFEVKYSLNADTLQDGSIDLTEPGKKGSIKLSINDGDYEDYYTVYVVQTRQKDTIILQNTREYEVELNPGFVTSGTLSINLRVTDKGGHESLFSRNINYGTPIDVIQVSYPQNGDTLSNENVGFLWNGSRDKSSKYELYLGTSGTAMNLVYCGTDTSVVCKLTNGPGIYFFQLIHISLKERNACMPVSFVLKMPESVKILNREELFSDVYVAGKDTVYGTVNIGEMNSNVRYSAFFANTDISFASEGAYLSYVPGVNDTGLRKIVVIASDTLNNISDTVFTDIIITTNESGVIIIPESKNLVNDTLTVKTPGVPDTITVSVKCRKKNSDNETYNVTINQSGQVTEFPLAEPYEFKIVVDSAVNGEILVTVTNATSGVSEVKKIVVIKN